MINQQLLTYIKKQQEAGTDDATIKDNLQSAGWREEDIEEGFQTVENNSGGGNSTVAHKKIRAEAAQQRDNQSTNTTTDNNKKGAVSADEPQKSDTSGTDTASPQNNDAYREPVTESDLSDSDGPTGASNLSPIDEQSSTKSNQSDSSEDNPSAAENSDPQQTASKKKSVSDQSAGTEGDQDRPTTDRPTKKDEEDEQTIDSSVNTEKSLESLDTKKQQEADSNLGPFPVRTYKSDSKRAGGPVRERPKMNRPKKTSPPDKKPKKKPAAASSSSASSVQEEGEYRVSTASESSNQKKAERDQQKRRRAEAEAREKMAKQEEGVISKQSSRKAEGSSMMSAGGTNRKAEGGRRRFSAGGDAAKAKQKAAARRRSRSSSSGSNLTAMLMFILALVLVGGGAVYAYLAYFQTDVPETTAAEVMESLAAAETFNFRTTIQSAGGAGSGGSSLIIEGAVDLNTNTPTQSYYTITSGNQDQPPVTSVMAEVENINAVPDTQRETVSDILLSPEFFSIGEFQTEEQLADFTTNRYSVSADSRQLVSDYATLHQALFNAPLSEEVLSRLQTTAGEFSPTQGQAWINPDTGAPYQITFLGTGAEGQEMQVNFQFKNHGSQLETTPAYEPRSFERSLGEYFAASSDSIPADDDQSTDTDVDNDQSADNTDELRRNDQLRINDIQQIAVALRMHANETGDFPASLAELRDSEMTVMTEIPRDPVSDTAYSYSVSDAGDLYHLGATLSTLERSEVSNDTNFNSRGQGFTNGFNGATASCGQVSESASTSICYDITGGIE